MNLKKPAQIQKQAPLAANPKAFHLLLGEVTALLMLSKVHRKFEVRDIADILLPTLRLGQFRIYHGKQGQPIALVTWAYFSMQVEAAYLKGKSVLSESDLQSGDRLYVTDFIAPYGHVKQVIRDLKTNVFPNQKIHALRFTEQGKTRPKLWYFYGVNYQRPQH